MDESYLEDIYSGNMPDIVTIQAYIRGWLVRKYLSDIQDMYEDIVADIDGDDMMVSWSDDIIRQPTVIKRLKDNQFQRVNMEKQLGVGSRKSGKLLPHKSTLPSRDPIPTQNYKSSDGTNSEKLNDIAPSAAVDAQTSAIDNHLSQTAEISAPSGTKQPISAQDTDPTATTLEFQPCTKTQLLLSSLSASNENEVIPQSTISSPPNNVLVNEKSSIVSSNTPNLVSKVTCVGVQTDLTPRSVVHNSQVPDPLEPSGRLVQAESDNNGRLNIPSGTHDEPSEPLLIAGIDQSCDVQKINSSSSTTVETSTIPQKAEAVFSVPSKPENKFKLPEGQSELEHLQKSTAMELLWVQQAINSRKHYLRLKQQLQ